MGYPSSLCARAKNKPNIQKPCIPKSYRDKISYSQTREDAHLKKFLHRSAGNIKEIMLFSQR